MFIHASKLRPPLPGVLRFWFCSIQYAIFIVLCFTWIALTASRQVSAAQLAYEGFGYSPVGAGLSGQNGGSGFSGSWSGSTLFTIATGSLNDPTGSMTPTGNNVASPASGGNKDMERTLTTQLGAAGSTVYFGFLIQPQGTVGNGFDSGHFGLILDSGSVTSNSLYIGKPGTGAPNPNLYDLENVGGTGRNATSVVPISGQTVLMVLRADFTAGNDTFRLYINPPGNGIEPTIANATKSDLDIGTISSVDELRIATTYIESVPEPSTLALLTLGAIGLLARRRFHSHNLRTPIAFSRLPITYT
jgi:hypothetical protein